MSAPTDYDIAWGKLLTAEITDIALPEVEATFRSRGFVVTNDHRLLLHAGIARGARTMFEYLAEWMAPGELVAIIRARIDEPVRTTPTDPRPVGATPPAPPGEATP